MYDLQPAMKRGGGGGGGGSGRGVSAASSMPKLVSFL